MIVKLLFLNKLIYFCSAYASVLALGIKGRKYSGLALITIIYCLFNLYIKNSPKLDIITYRMVVEMQYADIAFEKGFYYLISFFQLLTSDPEVIILYVQIFTAFAFVMFAAYPFDRQYRRLLIHRIICTLLSVAFILGVNNNLRQSLSVIFLLLFLEFYKRELKSTKKLILWIVFVYISASFHRSAIPFAVYLAGFLFIYRNVDLKFSIRLPLMVFANAFLAVGADFALTTFGFTAYQDLTLSGGRTNAGIKLFLYIALNLSLTLCFRRSFNIDAKLAEINFLRFSFAFLAFFLFLFAGLGEVASRILYLCFCLDLYLVLKFLVRGNISYPALASASGIFALNSINVWVL